jgi:LysM repeat protein
MKRKEGPGIGRRVSDTAACRPLIVAGLLTMLSFAACARLGPGIEHQTAEPQVTVDSLKTAVREGQRMAADLRIELADRRKELADVHVARAQLQGMLRETESRLAEARHIIELQRDELEAARTDRERIEASGRQLHSRVRRLEKLLAQARRQGDPGGEVIPSSYAPPPSGDRARPVHAASPGSAVVAHQVTVADMSARDTVSAATDAPSVEGESMRVVVVKEGETLWRLARRHQVNLEELRQLNGLQDNRIVTGWTLRLPASVHATGLRTIGSRRMIR